MDSSEQADISPENDKGPNWFLSETRGELQNDELRNAVQTYLSEQGWQTDTCDCEMEYYFKRDAKECCNSEECVSGYPFTTHPERNQFISLDDLRRELRDAFESIGVAELEPKSVVNKEGTTYFTVAGIQAIDDILFGTAPPDQSGYVFQPVVRTNALGAPAEGEEFAMSFINVTRIETEPSPAEYVTYVDELLDILSEVGLFVSDCTIRPFTVESDWGTGQFTSYKLELCYKGAAIAEVIYVEDFPRTTGTTVSFLDCGIGFERLCWTLNRTPSYFDYLAPLQNVVADSPQMLDILRTLTLVAGCGVLPGRKGVGYRFRRLSNELASLDRSGRFSDLIHYYHDFWSDYLELLPFQIVRDRIMDEYQRHVCRRLRDADNAPRNVTRTEELVDHLLKNGNSMAELRSLMTTDESE